ncbi:hypothetical protein BDV10DRAFT_187787 [Aspergillus recurvatus]
MALCDGSLEHGWLRSLTGHFKPNAQAALRRSSTLFYSYRDIEAGKTPQSFAQDISRHCRAADTNQPSNQMTMIFDRRDPNLRRDIPMPDNGMTMASFIETLEQRQCVWQNIFARYSSKKAAKSGPNSNVSDPENGYQYGPLANDRFSTPYLQPVYQPNVYPGYYQMRPQQTYQSCQSNSPFRSNTRSDRSNSNRQPRYGNNNWNFNKTADGSANDTEDRGGYEDRGNRQPWNRPRAYVAEASVNEQGQSLESPLPSGAEFTPAAYYTSPPVSVPSMGFLVPAYCVQAPAPMPPALAEPVT